MNGLEDVMHATFWKHRIDIFDAGSLPKQAWEPLLDELKAEHVPSATPIGKRMAVASGSSEGIYTAFIYRTMAIPDEELARILDKYGIPASVGSEDAAIATP
jgi:hypothetical protein